MLLMRVVAVVEAELLYNSAREAKHEDREDLATSFCQCCHCSHEQHNKELSSRE